MKYEDARNQFLQTWGKLGTEWGINRTMAQVHALLLISPKALSAEEIMTELSISRGNANMNLRDLMNWTLVHKELVPGDRKEYFSAEKDLWEVARRIAKERKRREIEPVLKVLSQLKSVEEGDKKAEVQEFTKVVTQLEGLVGKFDSTVDLLIKAEENWLFSSLFKLLK
ncbi:MAG TPA: transcriptional regulator [Catalimonadaceae bacterium]|nr:transcriptional regulator [Catalimonadaceae bacterium]HPI10240.1 transcriptional regulator [Catalimonadaceae bacterium]